jgi:4-hydroxy-tetrahydrodipicolinate synthase
MDRVIPAAMTTSIDDATAMILAGKELGCRAVLVLPPFYYGAAGQDGIELFLDACASKAGGSFPIDIILYHIPALSKIPYGIDLVGRLIARHGSRIVGIKDSTGDQAHTLMLARTFPQLAIFTGDDRVLPALLEAGGAGMIGGMPNVVARELCAFQADPHGPGAPSAMAEAALRIQAVDRFGGIVALKGLLAEITGDREWARPMPPLTAIDAGAMKTLRRAFEDAGFAFGHPALADG